MNDEQRFCTICMFVGDKLGQYLWVVTIECLSSLSINIRTSKHFSFSVLYVTWLCLYESPMHYLFERSLTATISIRFTIPVMMLQYCYARRPTKAKAIRTATPAPTMEACDLPTPLHRSLWHTQVVREPTLMQPSIRSTASPQPAWTFALAKPKCLVVVVVLLNLKNLNQLTQWR